MIRNAPQPMWQAERWGFCGKAERNARDLSHVSVLVFVFVAVGAGILASVALSSDFGIGASLSLIAVGVLFPLFCGWLAKERWRLKRLKDRIRRQEADWVPPYASVKYGENAPAGLLIVSPDMRICFADRPCLHESHGAPGWKIQDVKTAGGIEDHARALLASPDPAASCCFDAVIRAGERPVHITMTRIAPRRGEDRVLIVVEDRFLGGPPKACLPAEGYIC